LRGRVLEAAGRAAEARAAYERSVSGLPALSGDRDSLNSENFFMAPALRRLGRAQDAAALEQRLESFAQSEQGSRDAARRAAASYLLGLLRQHAGRPAEARDLFAAAVKAKPDLLAARLDLRGDTLDPLP
jgi:tetratricopeptide (TPR) repeat protein